MSVKWSGKVELGKGAYSIREASILLDISSHKIRRWLFPVEGPKPVFTPELGRSGGRVLTFLDLMQLYSIDNFQRAVKESDSVTLSLDLIRKSVSRAYRKYGIDFLFARKYELAHFDGSILIKIDDSIEALAGKRDATGQKFMPVVTKYLDRIEFNNNGLASKFYLAENLHGYNVFIDPKIRFGEPRMEYRGKPQHLASALVFDYSITKDYEATAAAFEAEPLEVRAAVEFNKLYPLVA